MHVFQGIRRQGFRAALLFAMAALLSISASAQVMEDKRPSREFLLKSYPEVGLEVLVPYKPTWEIEVAPRPKDAAITLTTPDNFYPRASIEMQLHRSWYIPPEGRLQYAQAAADKLRKTNKLPARSEALKPMTYGQVEGYADFYQLKKGKQWWVFKTLHGVMPTGQAVTLTVATRAGKLDHVEHIVIKIWNKLAVLANAKPPSSQSK